MMTFLQPWVLAALPLVGLPVIIHLINRRRFQTVQWAAMMFLLSARALAQGYSRLRHWLIMALRMLAVAAVILAVGRPLSRGWLALAGGGRPDTAVVILDRSPSMQQRSVAASDTKLATGRRQLAASLGTLAPSRCVLFTDPARPPVELESPAALADLPAAGPAAAPADIPGLLQAAYEYVRGNAAGATEVWICSDQRANDWAAESGVWSSLRDAFLRLPQPVRFQLLTYAEPAAGNLSVRVTEARLEGGGGDRALVLSVLVSRPDDGDAVTVPLAFEIGGASSSVELELAGREAVLKNHAIPLDAAGPPRGWGRVSIPPDANTADNAFFFVFAEPPARRAVVVADDPAAQRPLALVAGIAPDKTRPSSAELVAPAGLATAGLDEAAVVLWQAPLPQGEAAEQLRSYVDRGGQVLFFPPAEPAGEAFAGVSWTRWQAHAEPLAPETWRADQDLLANTLSGAALPVGGLGVMRSCGLEGDSVPLASLSGGAQLLARVPTPRGGIYFLGTTPAASDSTLASEGVVFYCLVQRAIDRGLEALGGATQLDAGPAAAVLGGATASWQRLAAAADSPSSEPGLHPGVYESGERLVAVNRPAAEDAARILADDRVDPLFRGLVTARISGRAGSTDSLVQEIWRAFLIATALAVIGEGLLCLPGRRAAGPPNAGRPPLEVAA